MNASLATRIVLPVLAFVVAAPAAVRADHYDRAFDAIERHAKVGTDQAQHIIKDVLHDVHDRRLKAEMMVEARTIMVAFTQVRVLARQERVNRMGPEVHRALAALKRLDHLTHAAERSEAAAHHGHGPDIHHIHEVVLDLTSRAKAVDSLVHQLEGSAPVRYEANYRQPPRPVYSRSRPGYEAPPSGISIGGRGFRIEFGNR